MSLKPDLLADLDEVGAIKLPGLVGASQLTALSDWSNGLDGRRAGTRIADVGPLRRLLIDGSVGAVARAVLGDRAKPVRAILFDKSADNNWALGWHQDRTIAVREHVAVDGFGTRSVKAGIPHLEPPFDLIEKMITIRIHIDLVDELNAPLLVAPSSHRLGRLADNEIGAAVRRCGEMSCPAEAGDIWVYRTAILHASGRSSGDRRRRVLQADYSADDLPAGLEWWVA